MKKRFILIVTIILLFGICIIPKFTNNVSAAGSINDVYSPYSYSVYNTGDTLDIGWTYQSEGSNVKIELYKSGTVYTINSNTVNDGSDSWTIPNYLTTSSNYRVKVTNLSDDNDFGYSPYFTINARSITVNSPDSDDVLYTSSRYLMSWSSSNSGNYAKIELYSSGSYVSTIDNNARNWLSTNSYYWTVPTSLSKGSSYRIKITSNSYSGVYDFSDYFSIGERSISITSPSGGEAWYQGGEYPITWTSENAGDQVFIYLYQGDSFINQIESGSVINDGIYDWTIPNYVGLGSNYKIRVVSRDHSSIYDTSNSFTIDERYIDVEKPKSGTTWFPDETYEIKWSSKNAGDYVDIKLYKSNVFVSTMSSNTKNNGSYNWTISDVFAADNDYRITIRSKETTGVYGQSGIFYIGKRSITVTSPAEEEILTKGSSYLITWDCENIGDFVDIELYKNGEQHSTIVSNHNAYSIYDSVKGSYSWTIPSDLTPDSSYEIRISSPQYSNIEAYSNGYISIDDSLLQKISGPLILVIVFVVIIIVTFIILKMRKKQAEKCGGDTSSDLNLTLPTDRFFKTDINQEEYNDIWEKNNL